MGFSNIDLKVKSLNLEPRFGLSIFNLRVGFLNSSLRVWAPNLDFRVISSNLYSKIRCISSKIWFYYPTLELQIQNAINYAQAVTDLDCEKTSIVSENSK